MRKGVFVLVLSLLLALTFLQGISQGNEFVRAPVELKGTLIQTSSANHGIGKLAIHGNKAAWSQWNDNDPDIWAYMDGTTKIIANTPDAETSPAVSDIIVWEDSNGNGSNIMSTSGLIYSGNAFYPDVDGSNVVFLESGKIMGRISGSVITIDTVDSDNVAPHISGDYVVYGNYVYSISQHKKWSFFGGSSFSSSYYSDVAGNWALIYGKSNFGKTIYIYAVNLKSGASVRVWTYDVAQYDYLDSIAIDGNLIVWTLNSRGYSFNLITNDLTIYYVSNGDLLRMAVGGGKMIWSITLPDGSYEIYIGDAPSTNLNYVEITLTNTGGHDDGICTLLIIDSNGNKLGYDANYQHYNDILNTVIIQEGNTYSYRLLSPGTYYYDVIGKNGGKYTLTIKRYGTTRATDYLEVTAKDISIASNEVHRYIVDWTKLANKERGAVTVKMDKNGDGTYESSVSLSTGDISQETLQSGGNGPSKEKQIGENVSIPTIAILAVLLVSIVVVVALVLKRKHKK